MARPPPAHAAIAAIAATVCLCCINVCLAAVIPAQPEGAAVASAAHVAPAAAPQQPFLVTKTESEAVSVPVGEPAGPSGRAGLLPAGAEPALVRQRDLAAATALGDQPALDTTPAPVRDAQPGQRRMDLARAVLAVRRALSEATSESQTYSPDRSGRAYEEGSSPDTVVEPTTLSSEESTESAPSTSPTTSGKASLLEAIVAALEELPLPATEQMLPPRPDPDTMESSGLHAQIHPMKKPKFSDSFLPALIQVLNHLVNELEEREFNNEQVAAETTSPTPDTTPEPNLPSTAEPTLAPTLEPTLPPTLGQTTSSTSPPETVEVILVSTGAPLVPGQGSTLAPAVLPAPQEVIIEGPIEGIVDLLSHLSMANHGVTVIAQNSGKGMKGADKGSGGVVKDVRGADESTEEQPVRNGEGEIKEKEGLIMDEEVVVESEWPAGGKKGSAVQDEENVKKEEKDAVRKMDTLDKNAEEAVKYEEVKSPVESAEGTEEETATDAKVREVGGEGTKDSFKDEDMLEDMPVVQSDVPVVSEETVPMMMMINMVPSDALEMVVDDMEEDAVAPLTTAPPVSRSRRDTAHLFPDEFKTFASYPTFNAGADEEKNTDPSRGEKEDEAALESLATDKDLLTSVRGEAAAVGKRDQRNKPSPALLTLVKLRFALNAEAKRQNFKNIQGFSERVMDELVKTSLLSGADQLGVLLSLVVDRNEIKSSATKKRAADVLLELRTEGSTLYAALQDLPALKYSP